MKKIRNMAKSFGNKSIAYLKGKMKEQTGVSHFMEILIVTIIVVIVLVSIALPRFRTVATDELNKFENHLDNSNIYNAP